MSTNLKIHMTGNDGGVDVDGTLMLFSITNEEPAYTVSKLELLIGSVRIVFNSPEVFPVNVSLGLVQGIVDSIGDYPISVRAYDSNNTIRMIDQSAMISVLDDSVQIVTPQELPVIVDITEATPQPEPEPEPQPEPEPEVESGDTYYDNETGYSYIYDGNDYIRIAYHNDAPKSHTHEGNQITSKVASATTADSASSVEWSNVQNPPATYAPSAHDHDSSYAPLSHTHTGSEITSAVETANKLGSTTVGDINSPIYINNGIATKCNDLKYPNDEILNVIAKGLTKQSLTLINGVKDVSGNNNHGQAFGGVDITNNSFTFDGSYNCIIFNSKNLKSAINGKHGLTFVGNFTIASQPSNTKDILTTTINTSYLGLFIRIDSSLKLSFGGRILTSSGLSGVTSNTVLEVGKEYQFVWVMDTTEGLSSLYINGILDKTVDNWYTDEFTDVCEIILGNEISGTNYNSFNGTIKNFKIFNRVITGSEVKTLYMFSDNKTAGSPAYQDIDQFDVPFFTVGEPSRLIAGSAMTEGYFGEVDGANFIYPWEVLAQIKSMNVSTLADFKTGFTSAYGSNISYEFTGDSYTALEITDNLECPWLKFYSRGKIIFVSKRPILNNITWDEINTMLGDVRAGFDIKVDTHRLNSNYGTYSNGRYATLKCRLLTGGNNQPAIIGNVIDFGKSGVELGRGSEWNRLMYRICNQNPTDVYSDGTANATSGGKQIGDNWAENTAASLGFGASNDLGCCTWCQEQCYYNDFLSRVRRTDEPAVGDFSAGTASSRYSGYGFRPALVFDCNPQINIVQVSSVPAVQASNTLYIITQ